MKIEKIEELAIIVYRGDYSRGVQFITPRNFPLQWGLIKYEKGEFAKSHIHPDVERKIIHDQEMIHIEKGSILLRIFNLEKELYATKILKAGDSAFFIQGGRGWEALEDTELFEVKQGPFVENKIVLEEKVK